MNVLMKVLVVDVSKDIKWILEIIFVNYNVLEILILILIILLAKTVILNVQTVITFKGANNVISFTF